MSEKLKPCPFCGSDRGLYVLQSERSGEWRVFCDNCKSSMRNERAGTELEIIAAWNSRAEPPASPDDPARYSRGGIECIDAIRAALDPVEYRGFCKGSVLGYVWREKYKGGDRDLGKAGDFIGYALDASEEADA